MRAYVGGGRTGRDGGGLNKLGPKTKKKRISQFVAYIHTFTHNINFVLLLLLWSMLIIIEQYIYVCVYAYTQICSSYLELTPQLLILLLVFILLFIYKIKLVAFYVLSCLTEIPTLTKNTHTYSIENCGSILTSFHLYYLFWNILFTTSKTRKEGKDEVTTFLYYKLTSTQSSSIVHHWC